ncbi:hypothetical protein ANTRET_LOCUS8417, partial [Anthophora retusa]
MTTQHVGTYNNNVDEDDDDDDDDDEVSQQRQGSKSSGYHSIVPELIFCEEQFGFQGVHYDCYNSAHQADESELSSKRWASAPRRPDSPCVLGAPTSRELWLTYINEARLFLFQAAGPPVQLEPVDLSVKTPVVLQVPRYSPAAIITAAARRIPSPSTTPTPPPFSISTDTQRSEIRNLPKVTRLICIPQRSKLICATTRGNAAVGTIRGELLSKKKLSNGGKRRMNVRYLRKVVRAGKLDFRREEKKKKKKRKGSFLARAKREANL